MLYYTTNVECSSLLTGVKWLFCVHMVLSKLVKFQFYSKKLHTFKNGTKFIMYLNIIEFWSINDKVNFNKQHRFILVL